MKREMVSVKNQSIPQEVIDELEAASHREIAPDEDCPELTKEQLADFAKLAKEQRHIGISKDVFRLGLVVL